MLEAEISDSDLPLPSEVSDGRTLDSGQSDHGLHLQNGERVDAKVKAKAKPKVSSAKRADDFRKCSDCKKWQAPICFNEGQARCKTCYNNRRAFARCISVQGVSNTIMDLESRDPKQHNAMFAAFCKSRAITEKGIQKVKFSVHGFMQEWKASEGLRKEAVYEMMWEGEFFEFARSAKGGFLTDSEARDMWRQLLDDAQVPKDDMGPRGYKRVSIKVADRSSKYEDLSRSQSARREEKLNKNITDEAFAQKIAHVSAGGNQVVAGFDDTMNRAFIASSGRDSMLDGVLASPCIENLLLPKNKNLVIEDPADDDTTIGDCDSTSQASCSSSVLTKKSQTKWLCPTQVNKAERAFSQKLATAKTHIVAMLTEMSDVLAEFSNDTRFKHEACHWGLGVFLVRSWPMHLGTCIPTSP